MKIFKVLTAFVVLICMFTVVTANATVKYDMVRSGSTGESVQRVQLRLRDLGFLHFKPTGNFKGMTVSATIAFQQIQVTDDGSWISADGEAGEQTQSILFSARARRAAIAQNVEIPIGPSLTGTPMKGKLVSWDNIKSQLEVGKEYKIYDYNTSKMLKMKIISCNSHAEVACATEADTKVFKEIFGGTYNYSKRPVIMQVDTEYLVAASLFGYPHGEDGVANNGVGGYTCLFFDGSRSHVGKITDVEHQKQIYTAAGM